MELISNIYIDIGDYFFNLWKDKGIIDELYLY